MERRRKPASAIKQLQEAQVEAAPTAKRSRSRAFVSCIKPLHSTNRLNSIAYQESDQEIMLQKEKEVRDSVIKEFEAAKVGYSMHHLI